jgi:SAM-dependent methyltransferase
MPLTSAAKTYPPTVAVKTKEQRKYEKMWEIDDYRKISPGEQSAHKFLEVCNMPKNAECIDFGCGTGRGGLMIALFGQAIVTLVDFAENALDEDVVEITKTQPDRLKWVQADLTKRLPVTAPYGYCTDVMEHLPPEEVDDAIRCMMMAANHIFFQISTVDDVMGERIGEKLHLTVKPYEWWLKKFRDLGAVIHWSQNYVAKSATGKEDPFDGPYRFEDGSEGVEAMCQFYISSWIDHGDVEYDGKVNTETEVVIDNIKKNAARKDEFQMTVPHPTQDTEVMMICGGPSLNDYKDEIIKLRSKGMPLITGNGTYNWAIENGMKPSMQLVIDAREFNKRFLRPVIDDCKYFIASQCHPSLFEGMPTDRTYIWHVTGGTGEEHSDALNTIEEHYGDFFPVPGGSTVTLRGLCLLRMLGFHKIHMYGFDSCVRDDAHHAYSQPENDYVHSGGMPVSVGGRGFRCDAWMFSQAVEFMRMVRMFGDEIDLNVVGDGLIAHIIKTGYEMVLLEEQESEG